VPSQPFTPVRHAALTDVGVKRTHNQDAFAVQPASDAAHWKTLGHIFVVADGMGGHAVGEKASAKAVRDIPLTYVKHAEHDGPAAAIKRAFVEANQAIFQIGQNNPEFKGLGTTGTALFIRPDGVWVGHVGDSRAYRVRAGRVQQLTFDHSWVWEVARRQGVDPDELGDFKKNVIIRSLGPDAEVEVDVEGPYPVEPGDRFLLCSDGLCNLVLAQEMAVVMDTFPPDEAAKFLVELANVRGGPDNITCVIAEIPADSGGGAAKAAGPGGLKRALTSWNKAVPWPLTAMGAGVLFAAAAVGMKAADIDGFLAPFALGAVLILAGLGGLVSVMRKKNAADDADAPTGPELHYYRDYPFAVDETVLERFAELEENLKAVVAGKDIGIDWAAHKKHAAEAAAATDPVTAFRARCLALQTLAVPFNRVRHKEESFRPNWKSGEESGPAA
jgi:protein phosphatase